MKLTLQEAIQIILLVYIVFIKPFVKYYSWILIPLKSKIFNFFMLILICYSIQYNLSIGILLTTSYILSYVLFKNHIETFNSKDTIETDVSMESTEEINKNKDSDSTEDNDSDEDSDSTEDSDSDEDSDIISEEYL